MGTEMRLVPLRRLPLRLEDRTPFGGADVTKGDSGDAPFDNLRTRDSDLENVAEHAPTVKDLSAEEQRGRGMGGRPLAVRPTISN